MVQGVQAAVDDLNAQGGVEGELIENDGTIYKKDLGPETTAYCAGLRELNPDATWEKSKVKPKEEQAVRFHPQEQDSVPLEF